MKTALTVCFKSCVILGVAFSSIAVADEIDLTKRPNISVTGEAVVMVVPDYAELKIMVQHFDDNISKVRTTNQSRVEQLIDQAKRMGVAKEDIATTPSMVFPDRWQCGKCSEEEKKTGYTAHTQITVTTRQIVQVNEFVTKISGDSHVLLQDVEYHTSELRKHRDAARSMAIRAAKEKATALAQEIGQSIGSALTISEQKIFGAGYSSWSQWGYSCCGYYSYSRYNYNVNAMAQNTLSVSPNATPSSDDGVMSPGRISVRAEVAVSFELRPAIERK